MLFRASERAFAQALSGLGKANPFQSEEVAHHEQAASGAALPDEVVWVSVPLPEVAERPDIPRLLQKAEALTEVVRQRLREGRVSNDLEHALYHDLARFVLYFRYRERLQETLASVLEPPPAPTEAIVHDRSGGMRVGYYREFAHDVEKYLTSVSATPDPLEAPAHLFALFFQIRRAFQLIHAKIIGRSRPVARLRAAVWQSIFTHDGKRYWESLYDRMHDITTLITGPSGTGKDLVAEAIGLSRYVRFDPNSERFEEDFGGGFHPVNLAALPAQLIESELFGHCKGAFTGAIAERTGWLEICQRSNSVFLDEIGEFAPSIQVKLLRVLQNRTFQRVGESDKVRRFEGKVIAATNCDLGVEIREGRFRRDLYYRLCSDLIQTPSLHEQLSANPNDLPYLVDFIARRLYGAAADSLTEDVVKWIEQHLGPAYPWPGNIRELEQCIRNILVRREYQPLSEQLAVPIDEFTTKIRNLQLTAEELQRWYCTLVYAQTGTYLETARRLKLDHRTIRQRIDRQLLSRLRE